MALKRQGAIQSYMSAPVAKRLKRLERKVARNKPETKVKTFAVTATVADASVSVTELKIENGTYPYAMTGSKAKILRVEIIGTLGSQFADAYLVQSHTDSAPVYGDFTATVGGSIAQTGAATRNDEFTIWKQYLNLGGGSNFRILQRFKYGYTIHGDVFNNTTIKNALYLIVKNNSGSSTNISYTARVWFVDA